MRHEYDRIRIFWSSLSFYNEKHVAKNTTLILTTCLWKVVLGTCSITPFPLFIHDLFSILPGWTLKGCGKSVCFFACLQFEVSKITEDFSYAHQECIYLIQTTVKTAIRKIFKIKLTFVYILKSTFS